MLRSIPKIDEILRNPAFAKYSCCVTKTKLASMVRAQICELRSRLALGDIPETSRQELHKHVVAEVCRILDELLDGRLRRVINATGVITHTNLGRALLSQESAERAVEIATNYSNLEYSLAKAKRRPRLSYIRELLCDLTGAEDALVVNNNAAAVFLVFNTLAFGRDVVISRGEIVEIGEGFRINEIITSAGATLAEVGTTNRTIAEDYAEKASNAAAIAKIHTSNYKILGYTEAPTTAALALVARQAGIPLIEDMGSGNLAGIQAHGHAPEPTVSQTIKSGASLVTFSGDKLLGGPQAGIIAGQAGLISELRKNQLLRCLRIDKLCLAALEATLEAYIEGRWRSLPTNSLIFSNPSEAQSRAHALMAATIQGAPSKALHIQVRPHSAHFGGGSMPLAEIPSYALYISCPSPSKLEAHLRSSTPPIISIISEEALILNPLAIKDADFPHIASAISKYNNTKNEHI